MMYLSWAALYEGPSDEAYFAMVIPLLMEDLVCKHGVKTTTIPQTPAVILGTQGRGVPQVAAEICKEREAFDILFIHADTGGRALEAGIAHRSTSYKEAAHALCNFPSSRCVIIAPRHETEAWMLADPNAVSAAMGYMGNHTNIGLPLGAREAERLADPKQVLLTAVGQVRGRRARVNVQQIIPAIAQRQSFDELRKSLSFQEFESELRKALVDLGCIT